MIADSVPPFSGGNIGDCKVLYEKLDVAFSTNYWNLEVVESNSWGLYADTDFSCYFVNY